MIKINLKEKIDKQIFEKTILNNAWNFDATVSRFMGGPGSKAFAAVAKFDKQVIDGAVDGTGQIVKKTASIKAASKVPCVIKFAVERDPASKT